MLDKIRPITPRKSSQETFVKLVDYYNRVRERLLSEQKNCLKRLRELGQEELVIGALGAALDALPFADEVFEFQDGLPRPTLARDAGPGKGKAGPRPPRLPAGERSGQASPG